MNICQHIHAVAFYSGTLKWNSRTLFTQNVDPTISHYYWWSLYLIFLLINLNIPWSWQVWSYLCSTPVVNKSGTLPVRVNKVFFGTWKKTQILMQTMSARKVQPSLDTRSTGHRMWQTVTLQRPFSFQMYTRIKSCTLTTSFPKKPKQILINAF